MASLPNGQVFGGANYYKKLAARITFYNVNGQVPTSKSPVIYDAENYKFYILPNGGFANHYQIYDYIQEKDYPLPSTNALESHGYYEPDSDTFDWSGPPYFQPNRNLENAFKSGIRKAVPTPRVPKVPGGLPDFKWAADGNSDPTNDTTRRPVIWWVDEDRVYLGEPYGQHYNVYEEMYDDGFDDSEDSTMQECHGYINYQSQHQDFYWYEPGAYGYNVVREPTPEEVARIKAVILQHIGPGKTGSKLRISAAMLPLV